MTFKARLSALTVGAMLATSVAAAAVAQGVPPGAGGPAMGPMMGPMFGGAMAKETFAQIDTNHDGVLNPDEIHAYVAGMIKGLDANNDGFLTADEIAAKMDQLTRQRIVARATAFEDRFGKADGGKVTVEALAQMKTPFDRMLDRMLKAGDGKITKATFDTVMALGGPEGRMGGRMGDHMGGKAGAPNPGGPEMGGPRHWGGHWGGPERAGFRHRDGGPMGMIGMVFGPVKFSDIDTKNQGYITADDIQAFKLAKLKAIDANGDGTITPDEFADFAMAKLQPRIQERADALVKRLDLNGDGKLSIEELAAAPLDAMFAHLPTDKDGNVTEQAFVQAMDHHPGGPGGWHHRGPGKMPPPPAAPPPAAPSGN